MAEGSGLGAGDDGLGDAFSLEPLDGGRPTAARPRPTRARPRWIAAGAAALLLAGAFALADGRGGDPAPEDDEEEDEAEVDLQPSVLQLAGPRDGNDSIGLPIEVEPRVGLVDGQVVTARSGGFVPGETVGIVQCADALPDQPGDNIDLCDISDYTGVTASSDGIATGTYAVQEVLVTTRSGSVDCVEEVRRCFIAMGAISDYDRSGGVEIEFARPGEAPTGGGPAPTGEAPTTTDSPPAEVGPPAASALPALGLSDGDVVRLIASGMAAGERIEARLCAVDPEVCWPLTLPDPPAEDPVGLRVSPTGYLEVDLQVWRFLPGPRPGTYVDCAVSQCAVRLEGTTVPDPVVLGFSADAPVPTGPTVDGAPREDLSPGDVIALRGAGFRADARVAVEVCGTDPELVVAGLCRALAAEVTVDGDGAFALDAVVPDIGPRGSAEGSSLVCASGPCAVRVSVLDAPPFGRPTFVPGLLEVRLRD